MSNHKARKNKTERPVSAEQRAARVKFESYSIEQETAFQRKYGHLPTLKLHSIAFELEMTSQRLRYMAWRRLEKDNQGN